jgi:hypothetical protein
MSSDSGKGSAGAAPVKPSQLRDRLPKFLKNTSHPGFCILHFIFKLGAFLSYLLLNIFLNNLVLTYIIVIIFLAFDFWVTKNITGR